MKNSDMKVLENFLIRSAFLCLLISPFAMSETLYRIPLSDCKDLSEFSRLCSIHKVSGDSLYFSWPGPSPAPSFLHEADTVSRSYNGTYPIASTVEELLNWDAFPSYACYRDFLFMLSDSFPSVCVLDSFGSTAAGHTLYSLQLSDKPDRDQARPEVLLAGQIHGDEFVGAMTLLQLAYDVCSRSGSDPMIQSLLSSVELFVAPLLNPDGCYLPSDDNVDQASRYNSRGIDLNRNFRDPAGLAHNTMTETESLLIEAFAESRRFVMSLNIHGGAEVVNYPWDHRSYHHPLHSWFYSLSRAYADTVHSVSPLTYLQLADPDAEDGIIFGWDWYPVYGGLQDFLNVYHGCRDITLELSNRKMLLPADIQTIWNYNRKALYHHIMKAAQGFSITVSDSLTGKRLPAEIYLADPQQLKLADTANPDSLCFIPMLPGQSMSIRVQCDGYVTEEFSLNSLADSLQHRSLSILPAVSSVSADSKAAFPDSPRILSLYPNPFNSRAVLKFTLSDNAPYSVTLTDLTGRTVAEQFITPAAGGPEPVYYDMHSILPANIPTGIYFISLTQAQFRHSVKALIIR